MYELPLQKVWRLKMEEERRKTGFAKILREMSIRKQEPKRKVLYPLPQDDDKVKLFFI